MVRRPDLSQVRQLTTAGFSAWRSSGLTVPINPLTGVRLGRDLLVHGVSPAIGWAAGADRHPDQLALVDQYDVTLTQHQAEDLTRRTTAFLRTTGLAPGRTAAVYGRNSAGFAVAIAAVTRSGADLVYLNPGFTADQVTSLCSEHGITLVLADPDLTPRIPVGTQVLNLIQPEQWATGATSGSRTLRVLAGGGRHIILTSGTTGKPKGADRSGTPLSATVSLLSMLPYRERDTHVMAAPLFHSWGWLNHRLAALLDSTEVMIARPGAEEVLAAAHRHAAGLIITTPVVVARLAEAGAGSYDLSALRGVLVSGAPLPTDIVERFRAEFGDVLYNLYGSTEVGYATVATPQDLARDPDSAGRPLPGVRVELLDDVGEPVRPGRQGYVWVGSAASFDGYVDGDDKDRRGDLVATGDVGYWTSAGTLTIVGRADDLIISGGENVHPSEVEHVLRRCPGVADIAAVGRPDPEYGQRVAVFVVPCDPHADVVADVRRYAKDHLAGYQRPRDITVVSDLPRNETGKVLRRLL